VLYARQNTFIVSAEFLAIIKFFSLIFNKIKILLKKKEKYMQQKEIKKRLCGKRDKVKMYK